MIVIGADTHKGSHALAAVDEGTGKVRGHREIKADDAGHLAAVRWARGLDDGRVWAIEDCRVCSRRLEQALSAAGERVVRVPPQRMGASRKGEREPGKSDPIDALAVARAVVKDGVEEFPVAYLNERAMEIRLLLDHRQDLVADRTRTVNRLRWHLLELCPELEASLKRGAFNHARVLDRVDRRLHKDPAGARVRIAREQIAQLRGLNRQIDQLHRELQALVAAHRPRLLAEQGCGAIVAAVLIGHTAGNERFRSEAAFGRQTGTAPIPCSSGTRTQHRLNRGGDRQLNHALHIIAVTRAQRDPTTKEYLARKEAEGKTAKGALRSLKRHLARHFHRLLSEPPADQQQATNGKPTVEAQPAAINGKLPEIPPRPEPRGPVDPNIKGQAPCPMVCIS
ncbi:MAG: IS110 family transposase [Solirubrobacterales bacterium]|nr:IS110 family transposase [Solirubrobacterales bacterium]